MKGQPLSIGFSDGCQFVCHGKDYQAGWKMGIGTSISVTCPHGQKATLDKAHLPPVALALPPTEPKEKPAHVAVLTCPDGCEFWMHGDKPKKGWILGIDTYLQIECPHGTGFRVGQGEAEIA